MSSPLKIPTLTIKIQVPPYTSTPILNPSASRTIKVAKKFKGSNSIDESIEKDFLFENGDPLNFLNPKVNKYEDLGYMKLEPTSNKRKSFSTDLKTSTEGIQKVSISRQNFELTRPSPSKSSILKAQATQDPKKTNNFAHSLISREKSLKKIQEKLAKNLKMRIKDKPFLSQRERSVQRFDLIKNKWSAIESGLMVKLNKQHQELLNNKKKIEVEKVSSKLPNWITTLRSDPMDQQFHEFIPVGNKLSGIFVRDIVKNAPLFNKKTNSCSDLLS